MSNTEVEILENDNLITEQITLLSLSIRNFMSYGNNTTVLKLNQKGTTFIVGQNVDDETESTSSNGVGKTSVLNAIVYALYNRALSDDINVDGLINNVNKKNMEVTLDFSIGEMFYRIVRARKMKSGPSGNYVMFFSRKGDDNFTDQDDASKGHSVYDTDKDIIEVIGMKYEIFSRIVVFSAMKEPFFNLPLRSHGTSKKANQTDFIEELFGLTELSEKAEKLKQQSKDANARLNELELKVEYQEREYKRYTEQCEVAERRIVNWEEQRKQQKEDIQAKLTQFDEFDFDGQLETLDQIQEYTVAMKEHNDSISRVERLIKSTNKNKKDNSKELDTLKGDQCPYCLQQFADNQHKVDICIAAITESDKELVALKDQYETLLDSIDDTASTLNELKSKLIYPDMSRRELLSIKQTIEAGQQEIEKISNEVNPFVVPLEELKATAIEPADYTEINILKKQLDHRDFLYKLLTKKDSFVRRNLLNKNLPFLNSKLQEYLSDLGLSHKVEFTHELSARITQFGRELGFGNLSAGQKARVNIALSFAFRDVLQSMHTPVNICMLDEILDVGLNNVGVRAAVKMLKRKARDEGLSMYIISHRDEVDTAFDRTLTVQMSKGFSYLYIEDDEFCTGALVS